MEQEPRNPNPLSSLESESKETRNAIIERKNTKKPFIICAISNGFFDDATDKTAETRLDEDDEEVTSETGTE
jgi:hypothetical protein